ncbi:MAG: hypothetical protein JW732_02460 [Dehalococcoidia bacterium]|nr:hypothetical protein [Dehalococcoidia bacterium]
MAVPSLLQMKYGKHKIVIEFDCDEIDGKYYLSCLFYNEPIIKGPLKFFGVRREAVQDIVAAFEIYEQGTGKLNCPRTDVKIRTQQHMLLERASLPASLIPARIAIACYGRDMNIVRVFKTPEQILPVGGYVAKVELIAGDHLEKAEKGVIVRDNYPFAKWVNS